MEIDCCIRSAGFERPLPGPSLTVRQAPSGSWLILGAGAEHWGETLTSRGLGVHAGVDTAMIADLSRVQPPPTGIIWLAGSGASDVDRGEAMLVTSRALISSLLDLARALAGRGISLPDGLTVVTRRAVAAEPGDPVDPLHSALWGLVRSLALECPELDCRLLDLDSAAPPPPEALAAGEPQAALRDGRLLVPRLIPRACAAAIEPPAGPFRLAAPDPGSLEALAAERVDPAPPGPGQVAIAVEAAGLNFRDVLNALALYPGDPGPLGCELAGTIAAVGPGVEHLRVGDCVLGLASGALASRVVAEAALIRRRPDRLGAAAAATVPVAFCTAAAAFALAGLQAGQRVLIHAASGGVGLAAVQIARSLGAEVHATASAAKRPFLRELGLVHLYDSRSTTFADDILRATAGRGVDVVLNSLTGDGFIDASLRALAAGGRFVEIAKRDIWSPEQMRDARPDVAYHIFALDDWQSGEPVRVGALLESIVARLASGELEPLPRRVYPMAEAVAAFRWMQQARHVGKIVLRPPTRDPVRPGATYLITGGLGALGLAAAAWLAGRGATHLVLAGRRPPSPAAEAALAALAGRGCRAVARAADVSDPSDLDRLLGSIAAELPPLRGIIHAAGARDDALLAELTADRLAATWAPKAAAAWLLHRRTADLPLDFFVSFSSAAAVLGSAGQAGYAAANAFLDGLAEHRRSLGLPALSVAWGPWAGDGMAADRAVQARLARQGIDLLRPDSALQALEVLLKSGEPQGTVLAAEWARMSGNLAGARPPLLERLLEPKAARIPRVEELAKALREKPPAEQRTRLTGHVQAELQQVLQLADPPALDATFFEMGLDSLMAVELRNRLNRDLELHPVLSANALIEHPTVNALVDAILGRAGVPSGMASEEVVNQVYFTQVVPAPQDRYRPFPLSDIQESYLVGRQIGLEGGESPVISTWRVRGLARLWSDSTSPGTD